MVNQQGTAIDMPAGPSEVLVMATEETNSAFAAADLLSQAEHGADSQVILVSTNENVISSIVSEVEKQVMKLPRKEIAEAALQNSRAILVSNNEEAVEFINQYAPEHLILNFEDCEIISNKITNAGSIFLGPYTPESAGDYASGTNHTLPTNGFAKAYGGVSLESFMKFTTVQKITRSGLETLGPVIELMAEAEQLRGHAEAVRVRYK
jgi:histidinol dehydrogenase